MSHKKNTSAGSRGDFVTRFEPRNASQAEAERWWPKSDVMLLLGPAGTGKTLAACGLAARDIKAGKYERLVVLRPAVEADRTLGFLPGNIRDKVEPYARPVVEALGKVAFHFPPDKLQLDVLGLARGLTYRDCVVLVTEAQNATYRQLKLVLTRLGPNAKLVFEGDPEQSDIQPSTSEYDTDFEDFADCLDGAEGVAVIDFLPEDVVRSHRLKTLLGRLRR